MTTEVKEKPAIREGWYNDIYVSPGGIAWSVERLGNTLRSTPVKVNPEDLKKPETSTFKTTLAQRTNAKRDTEYNTKASLLILQRQEVSVRRIRGDNWFFRS